jgi:DNA-binding CsgD family transcriptional regulator
MQYLGLTRREIEALALVARAEATGRSARIITTKTASVHVSRILAELQLTGRGKAAPIAHRLGLDRR